MAALVRGQRSLGVAEGRQAGAASRRDRAAVALEGTLAGARALLGWPVSAPRGDGRERGVGQLEALGHDEALGVLAVAACAVLGGSVRVDRAGRVAGRDPELFLDGVVDRDGGEEERGAGAGFDAPGRSASRCGRQVADQLSLTRIHRSLGRDVQHTLRSVAVRSDG